MLTKLIIPKKINVGFQKRQDTYTGKLAYVVYTDDKGVLRKEKSWNGWRDKEIEPVDFDNVPTSGFVLNKKVGEDRGGYNPRKAWIRVYDPRDFEFEISVANLLFILEETSAIKGKGLEGEFVYSWDGSELVLLPVDSQEYKASSDFTELQTKKITTKDMREGCIYVNKNNDHYMYLGRHDWYDLNRKYLAVARGYFYDTHSYSHRLIQPELYSYELYFKKSKQHVFVKIDNAEQKESTYWTQTGFTKLAHRVSEEPSPTFAEEYDKFKNSKFAAPPVHLVAKSYKFNSKNTWGYHSTVECYFRKDDQYYMLHATPSMTYSKDDPEFYTLFRSSVPITMTDGKVMVPRVQEQRNSWDAQEKITGDELRAMELYTMLVKTENDTLLPI